MKRLYDYKLTWIWNKRVANFIKKFDLDIIHVQTEIGIGIFARLIAKKYKMSIERIREVNQDNTKADSLNATASSMQKEGKSPEDLGTKPGQKLLLVR